MARTRKWIQEAIKRPGRVREYLQRTFGSAAFNKDGTIKTSYIDKAIEKVRDSKMSAERKRSLISALNLAKRLKKGI